jgi:hypothetical protein
MTPMTAEELARAEGVQTAEQWKAFTEMVKDARNGAYPSDWWQLMKVSGYMDRILARFGESSELKIDGKPLSQLAAEREAASVEPPWVAQVRALRLEVQREIVTRHVRRYTAQLEAGRAGSANVRVAETEAYLQTWQAGDAALLVGLPLPLDCVEEMYDALTSGEADDLLNEEELKQWQE